MTLYSFTHQLRFKYCKIFFKSSLSTFEKPIVSVRTVILIADNKKTAGIRNIELTILLCNIETSIIVKKVIVTAGKINDFTYFK